MTTETKVQHTPGPWRIGDAGCTVFGPKTDAPAPKTIASVTRAPFPSDEQRANAHLIAAAPTLLEALELALATIERLAVQHGPFNSAQGTMDVARQAIALAKGEQDAN